MQKPQTELLMKISTCYQTLRTFDDFFQVGKGRLPDPLKYEEWIDNKSSILKECDPHLDLMLFPEDDIEVRI